MSEARSYTVLDEGETWANVGKALGVSVRKLKDHNGDRELRPGDVIVTPDAEPVETPPAPAAAPCPVPGALEPGDESEDVRALQTILHTDGWFPYEVDGRYGDRTREGVQQLQKFLKRQGVYAGPVDGLYTEATRDAVCAHLASL